MKWKILVFIACILILVSGCATWEKDVTKNGIPFKKFRVYDDGEMVGILGEDQIIQGYPCKSGCVWFSANWDLQEFRLSEDFLFNDVVLPVGTWIRFGKDCDICFLPHDVEIQGYLCRGGKMQREGHMTTFYKNGNLKFFCFREDIEIDGILCKRGCLSLHENGKVRYCKLAEDTTINGIFYKKNTNLNFDDNGNVINNRGEN